jgi:hypothetical protein
MRIDKAVDALRERTELADSGCGGGDLHCLLPNIRSAPDARAKREQSSEPDVPVIAEPDPRPSVFKILGKTLDEYFVADSR